MFTLYCCHHPEQARHSGKRTQPEKRPWWKGCRGSERGAVWALVQTERGQKVCEGQGQGQILQAPAVRGAIRATLCSLSRELTWLDMGENEVPMNNSKSYLCCIKWVLELVILKNVQSSLKEERSQRPLRILLWMPRGSPVLWPGS